MAKKEPKQVTAFRLSNKHRELIKVSAFANNCSKTKVIESALDNYYRLNK